MLIEFSVSNFLSFREKQTFQMTAAPRLGKKENTFLPPVKGEKLPSLLKIAAIYGGNASGKTSLIKALGVLEKLTNRKPDAASQLLPVTPFRFDDELLDKPSTFEAHFIVGGLRYQFIVAATPQRITKEVLFAYPRGKETLLYSREQVSSVDNYEFGSSFEGDEPLRAVWRKLTGPQSLFISQAVANSSEELAQLRKPFTWLNTGMITIADGIDYLSGIGRRVPTDDAWSTSISTFLQEIDVPVTDIRFEPTKKSDGAGSPDLTESSKYEMQGKTTLIHKTRLGSAKFDFSEESRGTQNLVGFFLPYTAITIGDKNEGKFCILVVDEFDSSLHPEIVEHLVRKHLDSGVNAQIIFTTHDTHLMSTKLLRRDQFWVTDRNSFGATRLKSIHSVEGREGEDVEKRYYEGRYRGLPIRRGT